MRLEAFSREEFFADRFTFEPGEHWTCLGPNGCGKTWLAWDILERTTSPDHPGLVLLKKPRDPVTMARAKRLGYHVLKTWAPRPFQRPPGWVLHPPTSFDPDVDRPRKAEVFRKALMNAYARPKARFRAGVTVYVDDTFGVSKLLGLEAVLTEMWSEARTSPAAIGAGFQRPAHVPQLAYNNSDHLFLFRDADERNRKRYAEIGGIDPDVVKNVVSGLPPFHCMYICRNGNTACIIRT